MSRGNWHISRKYQYRIPPIYYYCKGVPGCYGYPKEIPFDRPGEGLNNTKVNLGSQSSLPSIPDRVALLVTDSPSRVSQLKGFKKLSLQARKFQTHLSLLDEMLITVWDVSKRLHPL